MMTSKQKNKENKNNKNLSDKKSGKFPIIIATMLILSVAALAYANAKTNIVKNSTENDKKTTAATEIKQENKKEESVEESVTNTEQNKSEDIKKTEKKAATGNNKGKKWVPPVYKNVEHPAIVYYVATVQGNGSSTERFSGSGSTQGEADNNAMNKFLQAQKDYIRKNKLPGCDGTYGQGRVIERQTVVEKEAWTEKVLVKEGYWK
ncbi:MAG TPA: hypothetical protein GX736_05870 [Mogibacterium sp.]|nr:hypothetical protein [Mogibacterium sp.]